MKRIYKRVIALFLALFMVITLLPTTSLTAQAEEQGGTAKFSAGGATYNNLQDAIDATANSSDKKIVLLNDGTITGDYTIPVGVTLLIPFDAAGTCITNQAAPITPQGEEPWTEPIAYKTLTMAKGSSITVEGAISVSARHWPAMGSRPEGMSPYKTYGYIVMEEDSNITVKNGGNLYVYGFISGDGTITAKRGATVYENMQISEFRGGTILSGWDSNHKVFPFSQYYNQNIEVPLTLEYGAQENVFGSAFMQNTAFSMLASFMGSEDSLFSIGPGTTITKWYDPSTDRLCLEADGDIALNGMIITMGDASILKISIDSKDFILPINSNISIKVNSGSVTINQDVALLPGAEVVLGKDAVFNIKEGCNLFIYDRDQWVRECDYNGDMGFVFENKNLQTSVYTPTARHIRTSEDLVDAVLDVNGTVNAYGNIYTTVDNNRGTGGASIISSEGTGKINYISAAGELTYTNQIVQVSNLTVFPVAIAVTPAKLLNADDSYTTTKGAAAGTAYTWNEIANAWVKAGQHAVVFDTDGGSTVKTAIVDKNALVEEPEAPTKEGHKFNGWKDAAGNAVDFPMKVTADMVLTADWVVNTYTITFVDEDETLKTVTAEYGQPIVAPTPEKDGFTFTGWDQEVPSTMPATNMTIKASWTVKTYTLSFVDADGSAIKSITQAYNSDVTAPVNPTKEGYTFTGWVDADGKTAQIPTKMPAEDITYKASWQVKQYTITFKTNGAGEIAPIVADYGTAITAPVNPEKEGYTFLCWLDGDGNQISVPSTMPAKSLELTAKWQINQYKILFVDVDGVTTVLPTITQDYNTTVVVPTTPVKEGHTFKEWVDENNATTAIPTVMPAKDTTLFATWSVNKYTITFYLDGGTGTTAITKNYGETLSSVSDPTKEGYDFLGWMDESGKIVSVPETMPAKNMTLTAKWGIKQQTLTFVDADGTVLDEIKDIYGAAITAPTAPVKDGYTFKGWLDESGAITQIPDKMPKNDATYTAHWQVNQYKVIFKTHEGILFTENVDFGAPILVPTAPTRDGYTFAGWDINVPETMPAENLVITATWDALTYTVVWLDEDKNLLDEATVVYGEDHIYGGKVPEKPVGADETGYYVHSGWLESGIEYEDADFVYIAQFLKVELGQFYVVFEDGEGAEIGVGAYSAGTNILAPANPTKEGHTFAGWVDGSGDAVSFPMTMPAYNLYGDTAIKATWIPNTYSITYVFDEYYFEEIDVVFGNTIEGPSEEPYKKGYTFDGWDIAIPETMPAKDLVADALWSINQYVIEFDTNGGSYIAPMVFEYGAEIGDIPVPTKDGYVFAGWDTSIPETMPAEDLVIEAIWEVEKYDIHFYIDANTLYQSDSYEYDEEIAMPANPTKEGYTFAGWDITIPETMPAKDMIVVARWVANEYTMIFDVDGDVSSITAAYGDAITTPANPIKIGYTFAGWIDASGKVVEIPATMPLDGLKVSASWKVNSYTLNFNTNGGTTMDSVKYDYNEAIVAPVNPTKEGYTFEGWTYGDGVVVKIPTTMPAVDVTLYAKWQINEYTITFNTAGGSAVPAITLDYGASIVAPANPGKEGYTFIGWDTKIPATMPAKEMTITALWKVNQYTVTFDSVGGSAVASVTTDYKATVAEPKSPVKEGYTFVAWVDNTGNKVSFPMIMPVDGMALKATWQINQYTVTFNTDGGSVIEPATVDYGATIAAPANPEKANNTFVGWVDEAGNAVTFPITVGSENITVKAQWKLHKKMVAWDVNGDGTTDITSEVDYGTSASALKESYEPTASKASDAEYTYEFIGWSPELTDVLGDTVYYAKFKSVPNTYTVTIDANGGVLAETSRSCKYDSNVNQPDTPTREGYTFVCWVDESGKQLTFPFTMPAKNITLKASWTLNEYVIGWDTNGDETVDDRTTVKHGATPTHADGVKVKDAQYTYTFTGWSPVVKPATGATTYVAQFKATPNVYTIKFVDADGSVLSSQKLAYGAAVTVPADPTKEGHTFTDWDGKIPSTMPAADVTITARWIVNTYAIDWDMDGDGKVDDSTDEAYGTIPTHNYIQKPASNKYTFTFIGWDTNQDGKVDGIKPVTGKATYTAIFEAVKIPAKEEIERIWGKSRYHTSLAIADELKEELDIDKFNTIIIANGENFPDALAGSYLSAKKEAPILMVNPKDTSGAKASNAIVLSYIEDNLVSKGKVYILGGTAAVPQNVEDALSAKGYDVERLKGKGRYDTNLAILEEAGVSNEALLVCTGINFADSLSASATGLPILLVDPKTNSLTAAQKTFLADGKREIYIIGGSGAVSDDYLDALKNYDSNSTVERIKGKSRYETSVEVALKFGGNPDKAVIASAIKFPDGLCGGPLAYFMDAPLILTSPTANAKNTAPAAEYIAAKGIVAGKPLGGSGALADEVVKTIFSMTAEDQILGTRYE